MVVAAPNAEVPAMPAEQGASASGQGASAPPMPVLIDDELITAVKESNASEVARILATNKEPDLPNARDGIGGMPALHCACALDDEQCARSLLNDPRTDVRAVVRPGMTAAHIAAKANAPRALALLLAAEPAFTDLVNEWGETALHTAATAGSKSVIALLLAAGADTQRGDAWGRSASAAARQHGLNEVALGLPPLSEAEEEDCASSKPGL